MRKIKFRGKNANDEWVYGSLVQESYGDVCIKEFECMEGVEPFFIEKKGKNYVIKKCNVRPVFEQC